MNPDFDSRGNRRQEDRRALDDRRDSERRLADRRRVERRMDNRRQDYCPTCRGLLSGLGHCSVCRIRVVKIRRFA